MNTSNHLAEHSISPPHLNHISALKPFTWLYNAWDDMLHNPAASLAYGLIICLLGALILGYSHHPYTIAVAMAGFMLVGPIMAAGLCQLSRQRSRGEIADFDSSLKTLHHNRRDLLLYASFLLLLSLLWFGAAGVMLYEAFGSVAPSLSETIWGDVFRSVSLAQIMSYTVIGAALSVIVFVLSIVTVPMIIDRNVSAATAMRTSLQAVLSADMPAMIVWAGLCFILVGVGFATFLFGMVVIFPLLGHATWHAYQDLVAKEA